MEEKLVMLNSKTESFQIARERFNWKKTQVLGPVAEKKLWNLFLIPKPSNKISQALPSFLH